MERITYAMVIQFFTLKKELTQDYIARRLELHKATISKAVSGSAHLNQSIKCGDFFCRFKNTAKNNRTYSLILLNISCYSA